MEAIILPRVLDTLKGDNVRRTYRIVNCKKCWIKSQHDNKNDIEYGTDRIAPTHFIKNAITEHSTEYAEIAKKFLTGG